MEAPVKIHDLMDEIRVYLEMVDLINPKAHCPKCNAFIPRDLIAMDRCANCTPSR